MLTTVFYSGIYLRSNYCELSCARQGGQPCQPRRCRLSLLVVPPLIFPLQVNCFVKVKWSLLNETFVVRRNNITHGKGGQHPRSCYTPCVTQPRLSNRQACATFGQILAFFLSGVKEQTLETVVKWIFMACDVKTFFGADEGSGQDTHDSTYLQVFVFLLVITRLVDGTHCQVAWIEVNRQYTVVRFVFRFFFLNSIQTVVEYE